MKCTNIRCYSPIACEGFGYCRNLNIPFKVTRLVAPSVVETQLTGRGPRMVTLEIAARAQEDAEKLADRNPEWFSRQP